MLIITETCIVRDKEYKIPFNIAVNRMHVEMEMCFLAQVASDRIQSVSPLSCIPVSSRDERVNDSRSDSLCKMKPKSMAAPL